MNSRPVLVVSVLSLVLVSTLAGVVAFASRAAVGQIVQPSAASSQAP